MFVGCVGDVSGMFRGCVGDVLGMFQGSFKDALGCFNGAKVAPTLLSASAGRMLLLM